MNNLVSIDFYTGDTPDITLLGTGTNRLIQVFPISTAGSVQELTGATLDGVTADSVTNIEYDGGAAICGGMVSWLDANHPGAGTFQLVGNWAGATNDRSYLVLEWDNFDQSTPFQPIIQAPIDDQLEPYDHTINVTNKSGTQMLLVAMAADGATTTETGFITSNDGLAQLSDDYFSNVRIASFSIPSVADDDETYSLKYSWQGGTAINIDSILSFAIGFNEQAFRIDSVSDTSPEADTQITLNHSNAAETPVTAGDFPVVSDVSGVATIGIFNPITKILSGQTTPTVNFQTDINIPLNDGSTVVNRAIQIEPPADTYFAEITSIPANSIFTATPAIQTSHFSHFFNVVGNWVINAATGVVMPDDAGGSLDWTIYNGEWSEAITYTVAARPQSQVSIDSLVEQRNGAVIAFSYPGADLTGYQYRINGGAWIAATSPLTITGQSTETAYLFEVAAVNNGRIGDITSQSYTTQDAVDTTPNSGSFTAITGQAVNDSVTSNVLSLQGVDPGVDAPVTVSGGLYSYSSNGGQNYSAPTASADNLRLNYLFRAHHTTSSSYNDDTTTTVYVGGVPFVFTSTTLIDSESPTISLAGGNQTVEVGEAWSEPGYTASDNADGDITNNVIVTGSVNTAIAGAYTLTYQVSDSAGNQTTVQRTITVVALNTGIVTDTPVFTITKVFNLGSVYTDQELLATDLSGSVAIEWSGDEVDTLTPGTYTRTLTAQNDAGTTQIKFSIVVVSSAWTIQ